MRRSDIRSAPWLVALAVSIAACNPGPSEPAGRGSEPLAEEPIEEASPSSSPSTPDPASQNLGDAPEHDASAALEALREVPFPVLLLPERFADGAVITSGSVWYAMSYDDPRNVNVAIHATNNVHMDGDDGVEIPPPNAHVRGLEARTSVNEGIRSLSWEEAEVAYLVEIECWDVLEDRRCAEPGFASEVAESLVELPR